MVGDVLERPDSELVFNVVKYYLRFGLQACKILSFTSYLNMSSSIMERD